MEMKKMTKWGLPTLLFTIICSCGSKGADRIVSHVETDVEVPAFSGDSAYAYVAKQTAFGPRTPRSVAHSRCGKWLADELRRHGADSVTEQKFELDDFGPALNIMGRYNMSARSRILLLAHWDSRPTADAEEDYSKRSLPIDGANDGASGVGVLLEVARLMGEKRPTVGVDILFVDAEDSGNEGDDDSWARGAQYFVQNMAYGKTEPYPRYAILLDMVGGRDAVFPREFFSANNAHNVCDHVWQTAKELNLGKRFVNRTGGAVNDDHIPLLRAGIPSIDIIETDHPSTGSFNPTWHTLDDNLENIDKQTLEDVGTLITNVIYREK